MDDTFKDGPAGNCPHCNHPLRIVARGKCQECGVKVRAAAARRRRPSFLAMPEMRYPNAYVWLVLLSALDVILTLLVLAFWGGHEVNPATHAVIEVMGFGWAIVFKFAVIILVVILCEVVGRRDDRLGRTLSILAVVMNGVPVAYTFVLLLRAGPATFLGAAG